MDCKDLMIGDWVYIHVPECKGHRIDYISEIDEEVGADGELYSIDDIRPIPLTEDILVKNGWDFRDRQYAIECKEDERGIVELSRDKGGYYWSINWDEYLIIRIHYAHELQHILRLCGIEKELTI